MNQTQARFQGRLFDTVRLAVVAMIIAMVGAACAGKGCGGSGQHVMQEEAPELSAPPVVQLERRALAIVRVEKFDETDGHLAAFLAPPSEQDAEVRFAFGS